MKKKLALFLFLCLGILFCVRPYNVVAAGNYVVDDANILTAQEENFLSRKIEDIRNQYHYDVVIVTNQSTGDRTAQEFADDFFDYNGYGYGFNRDGMILLVTFNDVFGDRTYWTSTSGYGIEAFTDYGIEKIGDSIQPYLSAGEYYKAFDRYLDLVPQYLDAANSGNPIDIDNKLVTKGQTRGVVAGGGILGAIVSTFSVMGMKSKMSNKRRESKANRYLNRGETSVYGGNEVFMYRTVSHRRIPSSHSSGGRSGGSSVHISSSGRTHGGGGGHF